jgi:DMSO/TMAO reductase YedYZ molybdopterin-dependent catalytic subunit
MNRSVSRRMALRTVAGLFGLAGLYKPAFPLTLLRSIAENEQAESSIDADAMILYSKEYLTLEMPMSRLTSWITPVESFFVRNNLLMPDVDLSIWHLSVTGEVERPITFTYAEFMQLASASVTNTIECAGNGRVNFSPRIGGVPWGRGGVGNAVFEGPPLAQILRLARLKPTAKHVAFRGLDVVPQGASDFIRSIPLDKATDRNTLLATKMNGAKLTPEHGFPVRSLVPGWIGSASIKWLQEIRVLPREFDGFYMNPGYRIPIAGSSRVAPDPSQTVSLTSLSVKSIIAQPTDRAVLALPQRGPIAIQGASWAGESKIARVNVSTDGGKTWREATLDADYAKYAWRLWRYEWNPDRPGAYTILSRAVDMAGRTQPFQPNWNPGGYLWNGVDRIQVQIRE